MINEKKKKLDKKMPQKFGLSCVAALAKSVAN